MNMINVLLQTNQCNILRKFSFLNIPNIKTLDNREFSIKNFYNNNDNYFDTYNSKSINDESIQIKDIIENDQYLYFIKSTNPTRDVSYINDNQSVKKEKETIFFAKKIKKRREVLNQYILIEEEKSMIKNQKIISSKKSLEIF